MDGARLAGLFALMGMSRPRARSEMAARGGMRVLGRCQRRCAGSFSGAFGHGETPALAAVRALLRPRAPSMRTMARSGVSKRLAARTSEMRMVATMAATAMRVRTSGSMVGSSRRARMMKAAPMVEVTSSGVARVWRNQAVLMRRARDLASAIQKVLGELSFCPDM